MIVSKVHHGIAADCAMGGTAVKPQAPGPSIILLSGLKAGLGDSHILNPNLLDTVYNSPHPESRFAIQRQLFPFGNLGTNISNFATNKHQTFTKRSVLNIIFLALYDGTKAI